ncbi:MAG: helix-turn-helix transcriptional regulator [Eubacteriales bacterium]|jgi:transcriptional regulator with XRE-family HTH domain|nr:helix-turn-helix transcriptional regulator [Eubacteriales bacterium]
MNTIGERIAELRKQKGMTQEELAGIIGVSAQSVSKWETSTTMPDIMLLPVIADIFDVTIDGIYGKPEKANEQVIDFDDIADKAYDALLQTMQRAWNSDKNNSYSLIHVDEAVSETKKYLKENPASQTAIYSDRNGAVYANADLGLIFKKPDGDLTSLLSNENAAELLAELSDKTFRAIMAYQLKNNTISFTSASVANKCRIDPAKARKALDKLVAYAFTTKKSVDMGDEKIDVYGLYGGHKMLLVYSIIQLADRLSRYQEHYRGFRGVPDNWFC